MYQVFLLARFLFVYSLVHDLVERVQAQVCILTTSCAPWLHNTGLDEDTALDLLDSSPPVTLGLVQSAELHMIKANH